MTTPSPSPAEAVEVLDPLVHIIASVLDYPSVYMGGPSQQSRRTAKRVIAALRRDPQLLNPALHDAGFVVVPREPKQAMLWAAEEVYESGPTGTPFAPPQRVWRAMIDAARPTPPSPETPHG